MNKIILSLAILVSAGVLSAQADVSKKASQNAQAPEQGDAKLSPQAKAMMLRMFDKDKDGYLNDEEMAAAKKSIAERRERFEQMQKRASERVIAQYDTDKDGKLSQEELIPYMKKQHEIFMEMYQKVPVEARKDLRLGGENIRFGGGDRRPPHAGDAEGGAPRGAKGAGDAPRRKGDGPRGAVKEGDAPNFGKPQGAEQRRRAPEISDEYLEQLAKPKAE